MTWFLITPANHWLTEGLVGLIVFFLCVFVFICRLLSGHTEWWVRRVLCGRCASFQPLWTSYCLHSQIWQASSYHRFRERETGTNVRGWFVHTREQTDLSKRKANNWNLVVADRLVLWECSVLAGRGQGRSVRPSSGWSAHVHEWPEERRRQSLFVLCHQGNTGQNAVFTNTFSLRDWSSRWNTKKSSHP